jgi:hypothetical protein
MSHTVMTSGPETLEKSQTLLVSEAELLNTGRETSRELSIPSKGAFWIFSVRRKRVMKIYGVDIFSLYLWSSIILKL